MSTNDVLRLVSSPSDLDCSQYVFYFVPLTVKLKNGIQVVELVMGGHGLGGVEER